MANIVFQAIYIFKRFKIYFDKLRHIRMRKSSQFFYFWEVTNETFLNSLKCSFTLNDHLPSIIFMIPDIMIQKLIFLHLLKILRLKNKNPLEIHFSKTWLRLCVMHICKNCESIFDTVYHIPLILKCGHTFCKDCIKESLDHFEEFSCLNCFYVSSSMEEMTVNHILTDRSSLAFECECIQGRLSKRKSTKPN